MALINCTDMTVVIINYIQTFVLTAGMALSALYLVVQFGIYTMGLCVLPFNSVQFAFGTNGTTCSQDLLVVVLSFLLDIICIQKCLASGLFVLCNGLSNGVVFLIRELCNLKR